ncbi:MAG: hypothetical protein AAB428_01390 [Patescibacteria group bacterium]
MSKGISERKNLPSTFVILAGNSEFRIAVEIAEAFSEFILSSKLRECHFSNCEIVAIRGLWEELKEKNIEANIEWLARESFPCSRWWPVAHTSFTKKLIGMFPDLWMKFKKNCEGIPEVRDYLGLF